MVPLNEAEQSKWENTNTHQATQFRKPSTPAPFKLDEDFKTIFCEAVRKFGLKEIEALENWSPPKSLLQDLITAYKL